jgi:hypothetical protein
MRNMVKNRIGALALLLALAVPGVSQATLLEFGATGTPNLPDVNPILLGSATTTLYVVFSTTGTDDPFSACVAGPGCIFGWTVDLTTTGTLEIIDYDPSANPNTASGPGATNCDSSLLPSSNCQTNGGDSSNGEVGTNIAMFSVTVSGGSPGDQLLWDGDFTESDFTAREVNQVIAEVIPEPTTLLLLSSGLASLGLWRKRRPLNRSLA